MNSCGGKRADSGSVFTDDSGARRRLLVWSVRAAVAAISVAAAGFALTLVAQVPMPGLDSPLTGPAFSGSARGDADPARPHRPAEGVQPGPSEPTPSAGATQSVAVPQGSGTSGAAKPAGTAPTGASGAAPTDPPATTPTPTPARGAKANRGEAAADAPRATPSNAPGNTDKTPPGKTK